MTKEEAKTILLNTAWLGSNEDRDKTEEAVRVLITALEQEPKWIPIKIRPLTDEEKEEHGLWEYMYDCPLPDDGQEVLVTDWVGNVETDIFCRDCDGCYFENNCDDGEVIAWMPLPEPYKESEDKE